MRYTKSPRINGHNHGPTPLGGTTTAAKPAAYDPTTATTTRWAGESMRLRRTKDGTRRGRFHDHCGQPCSVEESAKVSGTLLLGPDDTGRMRLSRDLAETLGVMLLRFSRTGELAGGRE